MEIKINGKRNIQLPYVSDKQRVVLKDVNGEIVSYIKTGKNSGRITGVVPDVVFAELEDVPLRPVNSNALNIAKTLDLTDEVNLILEKQNAIRQAFGAVLDFKAEIEDKFLKNKEQTDIALSELAEVARNTGIINDERYEEITAIDSAQNIDIEKIYSICRELSSKASLIEIDIKNITNVLNEHKHEKQTKESLGLGNVDNTRDIDKPVSKAVQEALDEKVSKEELTDFAEYIERLKKRQGEIEDGIQSLGGICANPIPNGGREGQVLMKRSNSDGDYWWSNTSGTEPASEEKAGVAKIATLEDAKQGADDTKIMTPLKVKTVLSDEVLKLNAEIDANADAILKTRNDLQAEIDDNAGDIAGLQADTTTLRSDLDGLGDQVSGIEEKIPDTATSSNQLADKNFVNSSIATETATFKGTFNTLEELKAVSADNNDYGFVISKDTAGNTVYNRYKYNSSEWVFEYALNNSSFTSSQWASINSGATQTNISQITTNKNDIVDLQNNKQDVISDLDTIRSGAEKGATAVQPSTLNAYAKKTDIPTKTSELENDSGFITAEEVPEPDLTGYIKNTATGTDSLTIAGRTFSANKAVNVGYMASVFGEGGTAVGFSASAYGKNATAVGQTAYANAEHAIQIGEGANNDANTMNVGLSSSLNVKLLDANGKIPLERLPEDIGGASSLEDIAVAGEGITFTKPASIKDYEVIGSPTVSSDGEARGFSDSDYLTAINPINAEDSLDSFEIHTAIKEDSVPTTSLGIIDTTGVEDEASFRFTTSESGSIRWRVSTDGTTQYPVDITGSTILETNKKYFVKVTYSSASGYALFSSVDGVTWTPEGTSSVLTRPFKSPLETIRMGDNRASGASFEGSIYLPDTYINVNGERAWTAWEELDKTEISSNVDLTGYLKNTSTYTNSLAIGGGTTGGSSAVAIGPGSVATTGGNNWGSTAVGRNAKANEYNSVAVGCQSVSSANGVSVGMNAKAGLDGTALGSDANATGRNVSIGSSSSSTGSSTVAIGPYTSCSGDYGFAVGHRVSVTGYSGIAIGGYESKATASYAIQLGQGTNNTANTMNVGLSSSLNVQLLDADGKIPVERLEYAIDASVPSSQYIDTTFIGTAVGTYSYTAPANGFFYFIFVNNASGNIAVLSVDDVEVGRASSQGHNMTLAAEVRKGAVITVTVKERALNHIVAQRFFYSQGGI